MPWVCPLASHCPILPPTTWRIFPLSNWSLSILNLYDLARDDLGFLLIYIYIYLYLFIYLFIYLFMHLIQYIYLFIDLHMINIHHTHTHIYMCVNIHNAYIFICGGFLSHLAIPSSQVIRSWPAWPPAARPRQRPSCARRGSRRKEALGMDQYI